MLEDRTLGRAGGAAARPAERCERPAARASRVPFHRSRFDVQPTDPMRRCCSPPTGGRTSRKRAVAASGRPRRLRARRRRHDREDLRLVSSGCPHPGLLPNEAGARPSGSGWVERAIKELRQPRRRGRRPGGRDPQGAQEARGDRPRPGSEGRRDRRGDGATGPAADDRGRSRLRELQRKLRKDGIDARDHPPRCRPRGLNRPPLCAPRLPAALPAARAAGPSRGRIGRRAGAGSGWNAVVIRPDQLAHEGLFWLAKERFSYKANR